MGVCLHCQRENPQESCEGLPEFCHPLLCKLFFLSNAQGGFFFFFKPFCLHFLDFAEAEELSGDGVSRFGSLRGPCSQAQGHKKRLLAKDTETAKGDGNGD